MKQYQNADDKRGSGHVLHDPSTDGTYISIEDEEAKEFRKTVVEWQMTNHPTTARCAKRVAPATCRT